MKNMKWYKYDIRDLTDTEYVKWYSLMGDVKKQRVDRFHFSDDKKRTVAGEMLARKAIAEWCGVAPESITFETTENGKPYAKDLAVEFNISHSDDMVVCATDSKPIGIDTEKIRPINLKTAQRICSEDELIYILKKTPQKTDFVHTDNPDLLKRFFEVWTAKEAYGKCIGTGILTENIKNADYKERIKTFYFNDYIITVCLSE